jgi:hypothetical protein
MAPSSMSAYQGPSDHCLRGDSEIQADSVDWGRSCRLPWKSPTQFASGDEHRRSLRFAIKGCWNSWPLKDHRVIKACSARFLLPFCAAGPRQTAVVQSRACDHSVNRKWDEVRQENPPRRGMQATLSSSNTFLRCAPKLPQEVKPI